MKSQFNCIDTENDDLLNKIFWLAARKVKKYPYQYVGKGEYEDND